MFLSKTKWKWKGLAGRDHPTPGRDPTTRPGAMAEVAREQSTMERRYY